MSYAEKVNDKGFVYWENIETGEITWENPLYETNTSNPSADSSHYEETDWVMYHDEDGNPYWYNEATGESEWAELDPIGYEEYIESTETSSTAEDEEDDSSDDSDEDSEEDSEDSEDSDEDTEEEESEDEEFEEDDLEAKFQAMLETPEGRAALEAEKKAILEEEARRMARKQRLDNEQINPLTRSRYQNDAIVNDIRERDVEAGGWGNSSQLSNRKKNDQRGMVTFDMPEPEAAPPGRMEAIKANWYTFKGTCQVATSKTKHWITKAFQSALLGAFSFAKYSLEYAERLTADDDFDERFHQLEDVQQRRDPNRIQPKPPKPPKGPPPSRTHPQSDQESHSLPKPPLDLLPPMKEPMSPLQITISTLTPSSPESEKV